MAKAKKGKKRKVKVEPEGFAYIKASFNNIIISLANKQGQIISWGSAVKPDSEVPRKIRLMLHR